MPRIASVWIRSWPIARFLRAQAQTASTSPSERIDPARPFALVAPGAGGARIVALNQAAAREGLAPGEALASARAKVLGLQSRPTDPEADAAALGQLALWCLRYSPLVTPWGEEEGADGLFLDIAGCAHLFGGEEALLADLGRRLRGFDLVPFLAIADTAGASWAVARYGKTDGAIVASGAEAQALHALPLAALRLDANARAALDRLGFRRIGELIEQPRAPFARRFGAGLLRRLDQALGYAPEALAPLIPPPRYHAHIAFLAPIATEAQLLAAANRLLDDIVLQLARAGAGMRSFCLRLFRVDGATVSLELGLAAPSRDGAHIARLLALRLDRLSSALDTGIGFDMASLGVLVAEAMPERQESMLGADAAHEPSGLARLIDTLEEKLGAGSVRRLHPQQSHIPERAIVARRAADAPAASVKTERAGTESPGPRPLLLFEHPEEAEVMALVPEGPPRQFRWRGGLHQVAAADGPERIAPEWWREQKLLPERDYYLVEDSTGRRFWLYRAGQYRGTGDAPRWFVHGLFP